MKLLYAFQSRKDIDIKELASELDGLDLYYDYSDETLNDCPGEGQTIRLNIYDICIFIFDLKINDLLLRT